jgi:hypothetical protein
MKKLYIGLSYPKEFKIGAASIAWWTNRPYSHVYVRFAYSDSKDAIFHAAHGMVHFLSVNNFHKINNTIKEYEIKLTDLEHEAFFDECMELAGEKYGTVELGKILTSDIVWNLFKKEINWKNSKGYICSELVGNLCVNRLKMKFNKPLFLLKPSDVDQSLEKLYPLAGAM